MKMIFAVTCALLVTMTLSDNKYIYRPGTKYKNGNTPCVFFLDEYVKGKDSEFYAKSPNPIATDPYKSTCFSPDERVSTENLKKSCGLSLINGDLFNKHFGKKVFLSLGDKKIERVTFVASSCHRDVHSDDVTDNFLKIAFKSSETLAQGQSDPEVSWVDLKSVTIKRILIV